MVEFAGGLAIVACGLFTGASIYINVVEHPARLSCGTEIAVTQWKPSYKRATGMQVTLAVLAAFAGVTRWALGGGAVWMISAVLIFAVIPFTAIVILPTNNKLLRPTRDRASAETQALLERWGRLHAVRSALSSLAFVLFVWAGTMR